jgi:glycosyltransferase involved in cell wall biosynthesis
MPEVSVVMGVFNGASHLGAAVDSILTQKGVDLELVVVDDGSTDGTAALLEQYERRDPRVMVIRQKNAGLTAALIRGCDEARGPFLARQDADDVSLPGRLRKQVDRLSQDSALAFVSCWADMVGPEGEVLVSHRPEADPETATRNLMVARVGPPGHGTVMMRSSRYRQVGGYRPVFYYAQDSDLWLRLGAVGKLAYVPEFLYRYSVCESSISGSRQMEKAAYAQLIDLCHSARQAGRDDSDIIAGFRPPRHRGGTADSSAATLYFIGRCLLARRDSRAGAYFRRCLARDPTHARAWASLGVVLVSRLRDSKGRGATAPGKS